MGVVVVRGHGLEEGGKAFEFRGQLFIRHGKLRCWAHPNFTVDVISADRLVNGNRLPL